MATSNGKQQDKTIKRAAVASEHYGVRLDVALLTKWMWTGNTCSATIQAPRVGMQVPEPWSTNPDVVTRPPIPTIREAMNALIPFVVKHREMTSRKNEAIIVTGIQVKRQGENIGFKVFAHRKLKNKPGQIVNLDSPGFVWHDHKEEGMRLELHEYGDLTHLADLVVGYLSGTNSTQLELMGVEVPEEVAA